MSANAGMPWFPFWVRDWLTSPSVRLMSMASRGLYCDLLAFAWESGGVPDEPSKLARLVGASTEEFAQAWPDVEPHWPVGEDGLRHNPRQEEVRAEALGIRATKEQHAKAAACARWKKQSSEQCPTDAHDDADAMHEQCPSIAGAMHEQCPSIAGALPEQCPSIAGALPEQCPSNADAVPEECPSNARAMQMQCNTHTHTHTQRSTTSVVVAGATLEDKIDPSKTDPFPLVARCLIAAHKEAGLRPPEDADIRRWIRANSVVRKLIEFAGSPEAAAELFVTASKTWKGTVSWPAVWDQRFQLEKKKPKTEEERIAELCPDTEDDW